MLSWIWQLEASGVVFRTCLEIQGRLALKLGLGLSSSLKREHFALGRKKVMMNKRKMLMKAPFSLPASLIRHTLSPVTPCHCNPNHGTICWPRKQIHWSVWLFEK